VRVLAATDKFRGTLTAPQAARAIAAGWRRERPDDETIELPMADGGEGTPDTLVEALGGTLSTVSVTGPLGDPVDAVFGLVDRPEGRLGVVEMARASGLALVSRRDPLRASTYGTGELIREAVGAGARTVLVCIGGSASTDGGAGMAQALGARLTDGRGRPIPPGGLGLLGLARIDLTPMGSVMGSAQVVGERRGQPSPGQRSAMLRRRRAPRPRTCCCSTGRSVTWGRPPDARTASDAARRRAPGLGGINRSSNRIGRVSRW
jgi:glycerate kinase